MKECDILWGRNILWPLLHIFRWSGPRTYHDLRPCVHIPTVEICRTRKSELKVLATREILRWWGCGEVTKRGCAVAVHRYGDVRFAVGYTMDVMYFAWLPNPIEVDKAIQLPQFRLRDTVLYDCSQNYTGGRSVCQSVTLRSVSARSSRSRVRLFNNVSVGDISLPSNQIKSHLFVSVILYS